MLLKGHKHILPHHVTSRAVRAGVRQRFTWGQAAVMGAPALVAWPLPQSATPWPQLHPASLRDPGNSLFVRPPSGLPEEKQRFHLSVSTYPFIYVAGTRERSWEPQPQKRGTLPSEESGGTGATCSPFPALAPQGSRVQSGTTWCLPSLTHSFHRYFHTKHLKGLGSERGDTAPPSKEPPGLWGDRVRSAGVQTGPARSHSPAQEDGSGCQGP